MAMCLNSSHSGNISRPLMLNFPVTAGRTCVGLPAPMVNGVPGPSAIIGVAGVGPPCSGSRFSSAQNSTLLARARLQMHRVLNPRSARIGAPSDVGKVRYSSTTSSPARPPVFAYRRPSALTGSPAATPFSVGNVSPL